VKTLAAILFLALTGCFGYQKAMERNLDSLTPEKRLELAQKYQEEVQRSKDLKPLYHGATAAFLVGIGIVAFARPKSYAGFICMGGAAAMVMLARAIPIIEHYMKYMVIAVGVLAVAGAGYWLWCYFPERFKSFNKKGK
jgi:heme exporter protein D